jgi:hypothetical protein
VMGVVVEGVSVRGGWRGRGNWPRPTPEYGIDIGQLRNDLVLSVAWPLRRHQIALNTVELLQKAKRLWVTP